MVRAPWLRQALATLAKASRSWVWLCSASSRPRSSASSRMARPAISAARSAPTSRWKARMRGPRTRASRKRCCSREISGRSGSTTSHLRMRRRGPRYAARRLRSLCATVITVSPSTIHDYVEIKPVGVAPVYRRVKMPLGRRLLSFQLSSRMDGNSPLVSEALRIAAFTMTGAFRMEMHRCWRLVTIMAKIACHTCHVAHLCTSTSRRSPTNAASDR